MTAMCCLFVLSNSKFNSCQWHNTQTT